MCVPRRLAQSRCPGASLGDFDDRKRAKLIEAWQTNERINLFLIEGISEEGLRSPLSKRSPGFRGSSRSLDLLPVSVLIFQGWGIREDRNSQHQCPCDQSGGRRSGQQDGDPHLL